MINAKHAEILKKSAIPLDKAEEVGIVSIEHKEDKILNGFTELRSHVPGLLFPVTGVDEVTYQIRADQPPEGQGKYRFPSGTGFLAVWKKLPWVKRTYDEGTYTRVLIVEGTKQSLAASIHNRDDKTLVVGIFGCWGWKGVDNDIFPELEPIVTGREVIVCFDADVATNESVNEAAVALQKAIKRINPDGIVKWITNLGSAEAHTGLDDYLGSDAVRDPEKEILKLISKAKPRIPKLIKRGEPTNLVPGSLYADESSGMFVKAIIKDGEKIGETPFYEGLVRVVKAIYTIDDPIPSSMRDYRSSPTSKVDRYLIEVTPKGGEPAQVEVSVNVFSNPNLWLKYFPAKNQSYKIPVPTTASAGRALVNAALNYRSDETEIEYEIKHLGWVMHEDEPFYATSECSVGPSSTITTIRTTKSGNAGKVKMVDPITIPESEKQEVIKTTILARDLFYRKDLWSLMWGGLACSVGGIHPTGMLYVHGEPGSGKTFWAQAVTAALSPQFAPESEPMANFKNTRIATASAYPPFNNSMIVFDDAKPTTSKYESQKVVDQVDDLARYAYGGQQRQVASRNFDKNVTEVTQSLPGRAMVVVTAENPPQVQSDTDSAVERMFIVGVKKEHTMVKAGQVPQEFLEVYSNMAGLGGAPILKELGNKGVFNRAISLYARWIAKQMQERYRGCTDTETYTPISWWMQEEAKRRLAPYEDLTAEYSIRTREVTRAFFIGWDLWTEFAVSERVITADEREQLLAEFREEMSRLIEEYTTQYLKGTNSPFLRVVDAVQGAVGAGRIELRMRGEKVHLGYNVTLIGKEVKTRSGQRYVALIPSELQRLTSMTTFQIEAIFRAVPGVIIGQPTNFSKSGQQTIRCIWVPMEAWTQQRATVVEQEEDEEVENPLPEFDF